MDNQAIEREFRQNAYLFQSLLTEVKHCLEDDFKNKKIKIHSLPARLKELSSILAKANSADIKNPISELTDIVGLRVICLFLSDMDTVANRIKELFDVLEFDDKLTNQEPSSFGYLSQHFICKIKDSFNGPRYDNLKTLKFEIQIRTVAMDAWANISHVLEYKNDLDIPIALKKDFNAISGLFYVADSHFEMFYKKQIESRAEIKKDIENKVNLPLDFDSLSAYLMENFPDRQLNVNPDGISHLVNELLGHGYDTISKIDKEIKRAKEAFDMYEKHNPPHFEEDDVDTRQFSAIGVIRISMKIVDSRLRNKDNIEMYTPYEKYLK